MSDAICLRKRSKIAGFTLLEMLVVLAILGLLCAIALPRLRLNEGARLRGVAHTLIVDLRLCRDQAIRQGIPTALVPSSVGYALLPSGHNQALPSGISLSAEASGGRLLPDQSDAIRFFPDGSSTGGAFYLHQGNQSTRIAVRGIDGKAQLHEW